MSKTSILKIPHFCNDKFRKISTVHSAKYQGFNIVIGTTQTPSERLYIAFQPHITTLSVKFQGGIP